MNPRSASGLLCEFECISDILGMFKVIALLDDVILFGGKLHCTCKGLDVRFIERLVLGRMLSFAKEMSSRMKSANTPCSKTSIGSTSLYATFNIPRMTRPM